MRRVVVPPSKVPLLAPPLIVVLLLLWSTTTEVQGDAFLPATPRPAFAPSSRVTLSPSYLDSSLVFTLRGGATVVADDSEDEEEEEEDESEDELVDELLEEAEDSEDDEEEEEEESFDATLAAAALKSTQKTKSKARTNKATEIKETMSAKLSTKKKQKKKSLLEILRVPYILRACLNPATVLTMTKHYWASFFNLEYPPKVWSIGRLSELSFFLKSIVCLVFAIVV
jgi:hypothetical protein